MPLSSEMFKGVRTVRFFGRFAETITIYIILAGIVIAGSIIAPQFTTRGNLTNVLMQSVALGMVAIGQTVVIIAGGIDISIGATISMVAVYSSGLMAGSADPLRFVPVMLLATSMALVVGLSNSLLVSRLKVAPFIATMAVGAVVQGVVLLYAKRPMGKISPQISYFADGMLGPVPFAVLFVLVVIAGTYVLLTRTVLGRYIYATGGNEKSARLSGISTAKVMTFAYVFSSFMAALSAFFLISRMGIGDPQVGGMNYDLFDPDSIAAVLVGGASLAGGRGSVLGTVAGFLIVCLLNNLFNLIQVSSFYQWLVKGIIILAAVAAYGIQRREH
ncbi:MAG TPA: ABC transporter permease [Spirochaetia bacterium]|nr:ABC transporter permease [Spirochaetia bacterium]